MKNKRVFYIMVLFLTAPIALVINLNKDKQETTIARVDNIEDLPILPEVTFMTEAYQELDPLGGVVTLTRESFLPVSFEGALNENDSIKKVIDRVWLDFAISYDIKTGQDSSDHLDRMFRHNMAQAYNYVPILSEGVIAVRSNRSAQFYISERSGDLLTFLPTKAAEYPTTIDYLGTAN